MLYPQPVTLVAMPNALQRVYFSFQNDACEIQGTYSLFTQR